MPKKARIGIIGLGGIANNVHLPCIAEIEDCEIVAICDFHKEKIKTVEEKYGTKKSYTMHFEMLENEELDGVFCLVKPDKMFRVVDDCLKAGVNVFMEKPSGINSYQANSLARRAEETRKILAVGMNRRHIPLVQHVLKIMNEVTTINQVDGCFMKNSDISVMWNYADAFVCDIVHAIDLVRYVAGSEPIDAATVIGRNNSPVDNAWNSVIKFKNGVMGTLRSNYQIGGRVHNLEIHGPEASAFINLGFGDAGCDARILYYGGKKIYSISAAGVGDLVIENFDGAEIANGTEYYQYYGYKQEDIDFINCLNTGNKPLCTIEDAAKSIEMVEFLLKKAM